MTLKLTFCLTELLGAKTEIIPVKPMPTGLVNHPIILGQTMAYFNETCNSIEGCSCL